MGEDDEANGVAEIEVTPEMIKAGVLILYEYDPEFSNEKDIVERIMRLSYVGRSQV